MATITLTDLKTLVRGECDQESSTFVSEALLTMFINKSADELYDLLVARDRDYYTTSASFVTVANQEHVSLPAGFYKLSYIELQLSGTDPTKLQKAPMGLHSALRREGKLTAGSHGRAYYWLRPDRFSIFPIPGAVLNGTIWYVPQRTQLVNGADTLDGVSGWEEYVVIDAALKCVGKEEGDTAPLERRKDAIVRRIAAAAKERELNAPRYVTDVDLDEELEGP